MVYSPSPENVSGMTSLITWANDATGNMFGALFLFAIFFTLFFLMKDYDTSRAFGASSVITALIAVFFASAGLVQTKIGILFIIGGLVGGLWLVWQNTQAN